MAFCELLKLPHKDTYPGEARAMRQGRPRLNGTKLLPEKSGGKTRQISAAAAPSASGKPL
jgi:hypothetical protein